MKINILSVEYEIQIRTQEDDHKLTTRSGYCDFTTKLIVIDDLEKQKSEDSVNNLNYFHKKILRHEIIHAFLYESGLGVNSHETSNWATNEEMVDWFAIQTPKIMKAFLDADCLD